MMYLSSQLLNALPKQKKKTFGHIMLSYQNYSNDDNREEQQQQQQQQQ